MAKPKDKPTETEEQPTGKTKTNKKSVRSMLAQVLAEVDEKDQSNASKVARAIVIQAAKGNHTALKVVIDESEKPVRKGKGGRPHKLLSSPDLPDGGKAITARICEYIKSGNYPEIAARNCGVSPTRFYEWRKKGEEDRQNCLATTFTEFLDAVDEAVALSEAKMLEIIEQQLPLDARLALEVMSRRFPHRWARPRDRQAVPSEGGSASAKPISEILSEIAIGASQRPIPSKGAKSEAVAFTGGESAERQELGPS